MINKDVVKAAVEEWLSQNDYFLVDVDMTYGSSFWQVL